MKNLVAVLALSLLGVSVEAQAQQHNVFPVNLRPLVRIPENAVVCGPVAVADDSLIYAVPVVDVETGQSLVAQLLVPVLSVRVVVGKVPKVTYVVVADGTVTMTVFLPQVEAECLARQGWRILNKQRRTPPQYKGTPPSAPARA